MLTYHADPFPVLDTPRLQLRHIELTDAPELFLLRSDPAVMAYLGRPPAQEVAEVANLIQSIHGFEKEDQSIFWTICARQHPGLIGTMTVWHIDWDNYRAEVGYMLAPAYQGQGLMTEALEAVVRFAFDTAGFHSLEAKVNPDNVASIRVLEKAGFVREGYFRENYFYNGQFSDTAVYSLVAGT